MAPRAPWRDSRLRAVTFPLALRHLVEPEGWSGSITTPEGDEPGEVLAPHDRPDAGQLFGHVRGEGRSASPGR